MSNSQSTTDQQPVDESGDASSNPDALMRSYQRTAKAGHGGGSRQLPARQWEEIRSRWASGEKSKDLALEFGVTVQGIWGRRKREGWVKYDGNTGQNTENPKEPQTKADETQISAELQRIKPADVSDETFNSVLAKVSKVLIAQGLRGIAPPRNVTELKTLYDVLRKATGQDKPAPPNGPTSIFAPLRPVRKAGPVIDAEQ